jgi:hypothetical protein
VVNLGAELHQRPHTARGALLQIDWRIEARGVQAVRARWPRYASISREGQGGESRCFSQPTGLVKCAEESLSCARGQVVIARPPVLTPPWRYRRSLVSKGHFAISINVICVGIRSSLPKRRYRVVIDYVGDLLRHRGKAGCWLFRGLWRVCKFGKTSSCLWVFVVVASD